MLMAEFKEAKLWKKLSDSRVQCRACSRLCIIDKDKTGYCRTRKNIGGKLVSLVYGRTLTLSIDPIEKKPLFHFKPGSLCTGVSTYGCNFSCAHCFVPNTTVLTEKGVYSIREIFEIGQKEKIQNDGSYTRELEGHKVLTNNSNFLNVLHAFRHNYLGEVISIRGRHIPEIECTPDHEVFVYSPHQDKLVKKRASSLSVGDFLQVPKIKVLGKKTSLDMAELLSDIAVRVPKPRRKTIPNLDKLCEMKEKGMTSRQIGAELGLNPTYVRTFFSKLRKLGKSGLLFDEIKLVVEGNYIRFKGAKNKAICRFISLDEKLARILGYYCAEGCVVKSKQRPNSYCLIISFGSSEEELAYDARNLFKDIFDVNARIENGKTSTIRISVGSNAIALFFKSVCGHSAKAKLVPSFLMSAPECVRLSFLRAYVAGDGWIGKGNRPIAINTVSKKLALGIYALFLQLSLLPSFYVWKPKPVKKIEGRTVSQSTLYYVKLHSKKFKDTFLGRQSKNTSAGTTKFIESDNCFFTPIFKISRKKYSGDVYNLEVEKDHSYAANFTSVGNCQNHEISQDFSDTAIEKVPFVTPKEIVDYTLEKGVGGIAYTYTEPTVFFEYALDIMKLAKKNGIYNVWVSNGYMAKETADLISPYLDAINIDLKGNDRFYEEVCGKVKRKFVLDNIKYFHKKEVHIEVTNLIIPSYNDKEKDFKEISEFVASIDKDIPLHFARFSPDYKLDYLSATDKPLLQKAKKIAKQHGLNHVYLGNLHIEENSYCRKCGKVLVKRFMYTTELVGLKGNKCVGCGTQNNFVV